MRRTSGLVKIAALAAGLMLWPASVTAQDLAWPSASQGLAVENRAAIEQWSAQTSEWTNRHVDIIIQTQTWLGTINAAVDQALGSPQSSSLPNWGPAWAQERRDAIAEVESERAALPPAPSLPSNLAPEQRTELERLQRMAVQNAELSRLTLERLRDLTVPILNLAATGDLSPAARNQLARAYYDVNEGMLLVENDIVAIGNAPVLGIHPNASLGASGIATNLAMIEYLRWQEAVRFSEDRDATGRADRIQDQVQAIHAAAAEARTLTAAAQLEVRQEVEVFGPTAYSANVSTALASYEQSALVEERIADEFEAVAVAMRRGDDAAVAIHVQAVIELLGRRIQLDQERRALVATQ